MRYKIGDKVIVREDLIANKYYSYEYDIPYEYSKLLFNSFMSKYCGKIGKIVNVVDDTRDLYLISIDGHGVGWYFNNAMLRSASGLNNIIKLRKETKR